MPAIGDLYRRRQRDVRCLRVGTCPIPDDDLDGGMVSQPCVNRLRLPTGEDINGLTSFKIDVFVQNTGTVSLFLLPAVFLHFFLVFPRAKRFHFAKPDEWTGDPPARWRRL